MSDSPAQHEATDTPTTIEHFGRTWVLPSSVRFQDHQRLNANAAKQLVRDYDIVLAETFLSPADFEALGEMNPTLDELDEFGNKISRALGFQGSGNS
jgi:hypothetical protein